MICKFFLFVILLGSSLCQHGYRRQMSLMRTMAQKAYDHGVRIAEVAQCSKPRAELVYLVDSNKIYLPRATLLHRCSDLVGCCAHATHSCQPSKVEKVNLYFFTIAVHSVGRLRQNQNIEQLSFVNHTECACVPVEQARSEQVRQQNSSNLRFPSLQSSGPPASELSHRHGQLPDQARAAAAPIYAEDMENQIEPDSDAMLRYWAQVLDVLNHSTKPEDEEEEEPVENVEVNNGEPEVIVEGSSTSSPALLDKANLRKSVIRIKPLRRYRPLYLRTPPGSIHFKRTLLRSGNQPKESLNYHRATYRAM